jgi:DNA-directed RNA polymerase specialized sigma24 family protein
MKFLGLLFVDVFNLAPGEYRARSSAALKCKAVLDTIPDKHVSRVLIYRYVDGFPMGALCKRAGCSEADARKYLFRGLGLLRTPPWSDALKTQIRMNPATETAPP